MDTLYILACGSQWKHSPSAAIGRELLRAFCEGDSQARGLASKFLVVGGEQTRTLLPQTVAAAESHQSMPLTSCWRWCAPLKAMTEPSKSNVAFEFTRTSCRIDGRRVVISDLSLAIGTGETLILLGRSGSGKTSALKLINRLLTPSEGQIHVEGKPTVEWDVILLRRRIGYAIQEVGLFPHYTVEQNISVLPKLENWPKERIAARVNELLELVTCPQPSFEGAIRRDWRPFLRCPQS